MRLTTTFAQVAERQNHFAIQNRQTVPVDSIRDSPEPVESRCANVAGASETSLHVTQRNVLHPMRNHNRICNALTVCLEVA